MAQLTFTTPVTRTRNGALLIDLAFKRYVNEVDGSPILDGDGAQQIIVYAVALVGNFDGTNWTIYDRVDLPPVPRKATTVSTFFGSGTLAQMEQKVLQFMQSEGLLPAGTVT